MTETHESMEESVPTDIHDANNHLKGTEFEVEQSGPNSPIRRGIITIDGAMLRLLVYPEKMSKNGRAYNPVRLQYLPDCGYVLKAVPVRKNVVSAGGPIGDCAHERGPLPGSTIARCGLHNCDCNLAFGTCDEFVPK